MARRYIELQESRVHPFPGALEALKILKSKTRLGLITNGQSVKQRAKIDRFALEQYFESIFVEEEAGFGKPDLRIFGLALERFGTAPDRVWMVGDNLEWDVAAPQKLGITGIWNDYSKTGLPNGSACIPDRIIHSIQELTVS